MIDGGGTFQEGSEMTAGPAVRHILEAYYGVKQSPKDPHRTDTPRWTLRTALPQRANRTQPR